MKIVVLDAATLGDDLDLSPLAREGELTVYANTSPEEVPERIVGQEVIVSNKIKLNRELRNRMIGMNEKHMNLVSS